MTRTTHRAHEEVRAVLLDDRRLVGYGADLVLIGSYKRHVSIRRIKDVDVFCKLPGCPADADPQKLLDHVFAVLDEAFPAIYCSPSGTSCRTRPVAHPRRAPPRAPARPVVQHMYSHAYPNGATTDPIFMAFS